MIHRFVFIICFLKASACFSQTLSANLEMPQGVEPGSDFIVKITITKSDLNGLIKFCQKIPENYTASEADSKGGTFTFNNNQVEITWLYPPVESVYSFVYKLKVPENAKEDDRFKTRIDYVTALKPESFIFSDKVIKLNQLMANNNYVFETVNEALPDVKADDYTYSVQFGVFVTTPKFKGIKDVTTVPLNKRMTRYLSGEFETRNQAEIRREELREKGFKDAFIVKFKEEKIVK